MEPQISQQHSEPEQSSLRQEPDFLELYQISRRLPVERLRQLRSVIRNSRNERSTTTGVSNATIRIFNDGNEPLRSTEADD
jgi:hypothetical protein